MRCYSWIIFLLLIIIENLLAAKSNTFMDAVEKFFGARNNKCESNNYKNDPAIYPQLNGYLYNLYTSVAFAGNEIFKVDPKGNDKLFVRTTDDGKCCRTLNFMLSKEYATYNITSGADCPTKLVDNSARLKVIVSNKDTDGSCCIIMWNCRKSREGVHAFCDKREVSEEQSKWIRKQFDKLDLTALQVKQTADYNGGKCFQ
ncbi:uncharacterized protein LOC119079524 [Bradysia coprophila]|uniref:uncharacterized protein LOC119079524 n=1 Tax=Bradysia coprophila TaxID=38358 RepID=UPI00187D9654|nr:uncharacterized protein LOC119079524 [Bradysia coprophila]